MIKCVLILTAILFLLSCGTTQSVLLDEPGDEGFLSSTLHISEYLALPAVSDPPVDTAPPDNTAPPADEATLPYIPAEYFLLPETDFCETTFPLPPNITWLIHPAFDWVGVFKDGFAPVMHDGRQGVVNHEGQVVVPIIYESLGQFAYPIWVSSLDPGIDIWGLDSRFITAQLNGKWGVVDITGRVIVPFNYGRIFIHHEHAMATIDLGAYYKLVNLVTEQEIVASGRYHSIYGITEQFAIVSRGTGTRRTVGLIDIAAGEEILPLIYNNIFISPHGIAVLYQNQWRLINPQGEVIIPLIEDSNFFLNHGLLLIRQNEMQGIADVEGNVIIPPIYNDIRIRGDSDYARVSQTDPLSGVEKFGLIDLRTGQLVIPVEYSNLHSIDEYRAIVDLERPHEHSDSFFGPPRSYLLLDITTGQPIREISYPFGDGHIRDFRNGIAILMMGRHQGPAPSWLFGAIDNMGREVLPPVYFLIWHFTDDLLVVNDGVPYGDNPDQMQLLNRDLQEVLPRMDLIRPPNDGLAVINTGGEWVWDDWKGSIIVNGHWGVIDEAGRMVIPPSLPFEEVWAVSEGIASVRLDGKWGFIKIS